MVVHVVPHSGRPRFDLRDESISRSEPSPAQLDRERAQIFSTFQKGVSELPALGGTTATMADYLGELFGSALSGVSRLIPSDIFAYESYHHFRKLFQQTAQDQAAGDNTPVKLMLAQNSKGINQLSREEGVCLLAGLERQVFDLARKAQVVASFFIDESKLTNVLKRLNVRYIGRPELDDFSLALRVNLSTEYQSSVRRIPGTPIILCAQGSQSRPCETDFSGALDSCCIEGFRAPRPHPIQVFRRLIEIWKLEGDDRCAREAGYPLLECDTLVNYLQPVLCRALPLALNRTDSYGLSEPSGGDRVGNDRRLKLRVDSIIAAIKEDITNLKNSRKELVFDARSQQTLVDFIGLMQSIEREFRGTVTRAEHNMRTNGFIASRLRGSTELSNALHFVIPPSDYNLIPQRVCNAMGVAYEPYKQLAEIFERTSRPDSHSLSTRDMLFLSENPNLINEQDKSWLSKPLREAYTALSWMGAEKRALRMEALDKISQSHSWARPAAQ